MEPKTSKKIVSKGAYVQAQGKRTSMWAAGAGLMLVSGATGCIALLCVAFLGYCLFFTSSVNYPIPIFGIVCSPLFFAGVSYAAFRIGRASLRHAARVDPGVPLTRANTTELPASDTLGRASSKPVQEQKAVLLRAATEGQETRQEKMLRASVGGQE